MYVTVSRSYKAVIPSGSVKGIFIIVTAESEIAFGIIILPAPCALCSVPCALRSVPCALCSVLCALRNFNIAATN